MLLRIQPAYQSQVFELGFLFFQAHGTIDRATRIDRNDVQVLVSREQLSVDGDFGGQTKRALQVYEAMLTGESRVHNMSGSIRPGSDLHRVLGSDTAPKWVNMPDRAPGIRNDDPSLRRRRRN